MKKSYLIVALLIIICSILFIRINDYVKFKQLNENYIYNVKQRGEIVQYEHSDDGLILITEISPFRERREFIVVDGDTVWGSKELKERIYSEELGIIVEIKTRYKVHELTNPPYGLYPIDTILESTKTENG